MKLLPGGGILDILTYGKTNPAAKVVNRNRHGRSKLSHLFKQLEAILFGKSEPS